jgi:hypothetical protein
VPTVLVDILELIGYSVQQNASVGRTPFTSIDEIFCVCNNALEKFTK